MEIAWTMLAVVGFAGVAWRALRAGIRLLDSVAELLWANELARARARRGDLTGMDQADAEARDGRRSRGRAALAVALWLLLLTAPAATPWTRVLYAMVSPVWLMPRTWVQG